MGERFPLKKKCSFVKSCVSVTPDGARVLIGRNKDIPGEEVTKITSPVVEFCMICFRREVTTKILGICGELEDWSQFFIPLLEKYNLIPFTRIHGGQTLLSTPDFGFNEWLVLTNGILEVVALANHEPSLKCSSQSLLICYYHRKTIPCCPSAQAL